MTEQLTGLVERITFHNAENGFCVLRVKVVDKPELVTVLGQVIQIHAGHYVECEGEWFNDKQYGLQFKTSSMKIIAPTTTAGIEKYLSSGLVKGIGPHFAKKLVDHFGEQVLEIVEENPQRLHEIAGLGKTRIDRIIGSWSEQNEIRAIVVFLQSHGLGTARAVRIHKTYGRAAIQKVQENPYRLALDVHGIGFKTADELALRLGIPENSVLRAEAGIRHILQEATKDGHSAVLQAEVMDASQRLLQLDPDILLRAIHNEVKAKRLTQVSRMGVAYLYLSHLYWAEQGVADHIARLISVPLNLPAQSTAQILVAEKLLAIELSESQRKAVTKILANKLSIVTGGPGVGKTTIIQVVLHILLGLKQSVNLCAPTGRAAKRLQETTGQVAKTLHRLLEFEPSNRAFKRREDYPLQIDWCVLDESSMVDLVLFHQFLRALPDNCAVIIVGDVDQLPSVGPGSVLQDLISSECLAVAHLTEIFRQAKDSEIILNAHAVNAGQMPEISHDKNHLRDFYFIEAESPDEIKEKLLQVVAQRIPQRFSFDPIRDVQVLTPMNRGGLGVRSLTVELQALLNPNPQAQLSRFGVEYGVGDKVIQLVNNYDKEVFNGDIGFITAIDRQAAELCIDFDGHTLVYDLSELDELMLAYATTIHKSQGSEYPVVVIPISTQHYTLLERNLVYTAMTRGRKLVVLIGQKRALEIAVQNKKSGLRTGFLMSQLQQVLKINKL